MNASDRFEVIAKKFYQDTGMLAPGKDYPAGEQPSHDYQERMDTYKIWIENFYSELFSKNFVLPE